MMGGGLYDEWLRFHKKIVTFTPFIRLMGYGFFKNKRKKNSKYCRIEGQDVFRKEPFTCFTVILR